MLGKQRRTHEIQRAVHADLKAIRNMQPPGFKLEAAVAKFAHKTRSDERAAAWAAVIEQQPTSGMLANLVDRLGIRKLVAVTFVLFAGAATAGTLGVLARDPVLPDPVVDAARAEKAAPEATGVAITALPMPPRPNPQRTAPVRRATSPATGPGVEQEIAHMVMLRSLVDKAPHRALVWAEQGHRRFAQGVLFEEREALYVMALIKAQGVNAAKPRAQAFLRRFPKGSFAARIKLAVKR